MTRTHGVWMAALGLVVLLSGCARPQKTQEEVANGYPPASLGTGPTPSGGPSAAPTAYGAGGSGAGGYELGRVGGFDPQPTAPAYPPGRMAPTYADGSGTGDRGYAIDPSVSLAVGPEAGKLSAPREPKSPPKNRRSELTQ